MHQLKVNVHKAARSARSPQPPIFPTCPCTLTQRIPRRDFGTGCQNGGAIQHPTLSEQPIHAHDFNTLPAQHSYNVSQHAQRRRQNKNHSHSAKPLAFNRPLRPIVVPQLPSSKPQQPPNSSLTRILSPRDVNLTSEALQHTPLHTCYPIRDGWGRERGECRLPSANRVYCGRMLGLFEGRTSLILSIDI
jgi:hypothetical protein